MSVPDGAEADAILALADRTREHIVATLAAGEMADVGRALSQRGVDCGELVSLVERYPLDAQAQARVAALRDACAGTASTAFERFLLLQTADRIVGSIADLPLGASVKKLFLEELEFFAAPDKRRAPLLSLGTPTFSASCELVSLRRFPAGQLHWNVSGLPRRVLAHVPLRDLPRVLLFLARKMKGVAPAFFSHVNGLRRNRFVWLEEESNRAYARMTDSLRFQPKVLGLVTISWFHDPVIAEVSPHLAWTNRVILENGGLVVSAGPASPADGAMENNRERQLAYEQGTYRPRLGLVLWPRQAMLDWLARNPQLLDAGP